MGFMHLFGVFIEKNALGSDNILYNGLQRD